MIKCNRCGNVNTAGTMRCQSCGSAFSGMDVSGSGSNTASQEQSALPAWLESLRVGERTPRPANDSPKFSTADLIEEGSLPSWMQAQRNETQNVTGANMPVSLRSSSLPAPSTDGAPFSATSFAAQSLIDEQALPSWMQEREASTSLPPEDGVSAAHLVDKGSMPDWMKSLQQPPQSGVTGPGQPKQAPSTESTVRSVEPVSSQSSLASGFAARDLVDQQSLPAWMSQLGDQNVATSADREQLMQPQSFSQSAVNAQPQPIQPGQKGFAARDLVDQQSLPAWMSQLGNQNVTTSADREQLMQPQSFSQSAVNGQSQPIQPGQKGFVARDLVDQQSLPAWMVPQSGQNPAAPTNPGQERQSNQPVTGLPGSSLLDMNALPSWMTENRQAQATSPAYSQPPTSMAPSSQLWPAQEPNVQGSAADFSSMQDGHIAASSVIDMNALPEWLRSSAGQQAVPSTSSQSYSAPYVGGPSRVENVRVPSRPRSEMTSSETSEIAASVFASMLGVASGAPNFPGSNGIPYQQQSGPLSYGEQMSLSGVSGIASMPQFGNPGAQSMAGGPGFQSMAGIPGGSGIQSMAGIPGGPVAQSTAGIPGGSGIQSMAGIPGGPGAQSTAGIPGGSGIQSMAGIPGRPGAQSMVGIPGGSGIHSMAGIPGGPGAQSMVGIPGGSGIHSMAGIPGGPGAQSMVGIPGGSGIHSMAGIPGGPGAQSMVGIPGGSGIHSMAGIPGGPGAQSMAGNAYRNPTGAPTGPSTLGMAGEEKNTKKRGLFGALLDWLSR